MSSILQQVQCIHCGQLYDADEVITHCFYCGKPIIEECNDLSISELLSKNSPKEEYPDYDLNDIYY